jgi:hypothetical protein
MIAMATSPLSAKEQPFDAGEELDFTFRYKYGLFMLKAGTAKLTVKDAHYNYTVANEIMLTIKTSSFFDKIYKIRDTLQSYMNRHLEPMYNIRRLHEHKTNYNEEIFYNTFSHNYSEVRVIRADNNNVKFDTVLHCNNHGFDILSIIVFARTLDYQNMHKGQTMKITNFIGKDNINILIKYKKETVDIGGNEYEAYKLNIDVSDKAFNESKNAMEIWISADKNRIPLKVKAKLKIGATEVELASHRNLKYSLSSKKDKTI